MASRTQALRLDDPPPSLPAPDRVRDLLDRRCPMRAPRAGLWSRRRSLALIATFGSSLWLGLIGLAGLALRAVG